MLAGGSGLLLLAAAPGGDISHLDGPLRFSCCSCAPAVVQLKALSARSWVQEPAELSHPAALGGSGAEGSRIPAAGSVLGTGSGNLHYWMPPAHRFR